MAKWSSRVLWACGLVWFVAVGADSAAASTTCPSSTFPPQVTTQTQQVTTQTQQVTTQTPQATTQTPQATTQAAAGQRLRVFLDCDCFETYLREEIDWVDYVRQAQDADVHLMSRTTSTGGGGSELVLRFVGRGQFEGVDQELRAVTLSGDSEDTRRRAVARAVTVGLLGYMARAGLPANVDVSVEAREAAAAETRQDRWNLWVYEVRADGSFEAQESSRSRDLRLRASADRVSAMWKISFGASTEQELERFNLEPDPDDPDGSGTFETRRRESSVEGMVVRSLGTHWSFGGGSEVDSSTFGNTKLKARAGAAVEFSVFPYEDYATRQLVVQYLAGVERAEYNEITLFDKLSETVGFHETSVRLDQQQPWGSLQAEVQFSQYLHDLSKYRLEVSGEVDIRVARGLSLSFDGRASRIRDQLSLPKRGASASEVFLRLRELQSGYEIDFSFGITYSFGSLFNNVVNPRFGGW